MSIHIQVVATLIKKVELKKVIKAYFIKNSWILGSILKVAVYLVNSNQFDLYESLQFLTEIGR